MDFPKFGSETLEMAKIKGREDYPIYFGAKPELLKIAGDLRRNMTPAEKLLWERLRSKQLMGFRFRRQHPIFEFVVDFFCYEAMLVVEVDGAVHEDSYQAERDIERTKILNNIGLTELRFSNQQIKEDLDNVLAEIERYLK